ncbi:hypothetical protein PATSB16_19580 [Pandoraea thiooxydans]|nr:hypothetical protein PATSB16_19580 [Pandoraea thiooxydans]
MERGDGRAVLAHVLATRSGDENGPVDPPCACPARSTLPEPLYA